MKIDEDDSLRETAISLGKSIYEALKLALNDEKRSREIKLNALNIALTCTIYECYDMKHWELVGEEFGKTFKETIKKFRELEEN